MKVVIVIPARYNSSRLPGKPLIKLLGKPMINWVAELSAKVVGKENVYIATEDSRIYNSISQKGFKGVMTSKDCLTGTDRLSEVAESVNADIYINIQGDEPLVNPKDVLKVIEAKKLYPDEIINGYTVIEKNEDPENLNIPKVIFTKDKRLVYISRKALPGFKDPKNQPLIYYKQVCIYAFNREELMLFGRSGAKSVLENSEDIEILRFLDLKKTIHVVKTKSGSLAVDTPKDVEKVEKILRTKSHKVF